MLPCGGGLGLNRNMLGAGSGKWNLYWYNDNGPHRNFGSQANSRTQVCARNQLIIRTYPSESVIAAVNGVRRNICKAMFADKIWSVRSSAAILWGDSLEQWNASRWNSSFNYMHWKPYKQRNTHGKRNALTANSANGICHRTHRPPHNITCAYRRANCVLLSSKASA